MRICMHKFRVVAHAYGTLWQLVACAKKTCESSAKKFRVSEVVYTSQKIKEGQKVVVQMSRAISLNNDTFPPLLYRRMPFAEAMLLRELPSRNVPKLTFKLQKKLADISAVTRSLSVGML